MSKLRDEAVQSVSAVAAVAAAQMASAWSACAAEAWREAPRAASICCSYSWLG